MNSNANTRSTVSQVADLVGRAQRGESDAFATLFDMHKRRVYSLCLRMTKNVAQAEELAQDAFIQVFRKLSSFRGDSAFSTWLYRVAMNTVLMHFRRKSICEVSLDQPTTKYEDSEPIVREYATTDDRLEGSVTRIALARAISSLPEGYRMIFVLHDVEGHQHHEIAELLGCTTGNSKSQLHKARMRIREYLANPRENGAEKRQSDRPSVVPFSLRNNKECLT